MSADEKTDGGQRQQELADLTRQTRVIWNENATFWDAYMGDEGNAFQRLLIGPATERLLELRAGEIVLDVACGNGTMARRMAALGARVVACDFSERFIQAARARTIPSDERLEYRVIDATDEAQLLTLGAGRFDAAICNQAFMDMTTIDPLLAALRQLLRPGGRFVFSLSHPCFNTGDVKKVVEEEDRDGELVTVHAIKIARYIQPVTSRGLGIVGQPTPHYYFDRPLSLLLASCFRAGFVLDGLEEPTFADSSTANRPFSWANFREIPPVLVARLRPAS